MDIDSKDDKLICPVKQGRPNIDATLPTPKRPDDAMSTGVDIEEPSPFEQLDHGERQGSEVDWGEWEDFEDELPGGSESEIDFQSSVPC